MYENNRKHYRLNQTTLKGTPQKGMYMTKKQQSDMFIMGLFLATLSLVVSVITAIRVSK